MSFIHFAAVSIESLILPRRINITKSILVTRDIFFSSSSKLLISSSMKIMNKKKMWKNQRDYFTFHNKWMFAVAKQQQQQAQTATIFPDDGWRDAKDTRNTQCKHPYTDANKPLPCHRGRFLSMYVCYRFAMTCMHGANIHASDFAIRIYQRRKISKRFSKITSKPFTLSLVSLELFLLYFISSFVCSFVRIHLIVVRWWFAP